MRAEAELDDHFPCYCYVGSHIAFRTTDARDALRAVGCCGPSRGSVGAEGDADGVEAAQIERPKEASKLAWPSLLSVGLPLLMLLKKGQVVAGGRKTSRSLSGRGICRGTSYSSCVIVVSGNAPRFAVRPRDDEWQRAARAKRKTY